MDSRLTWASCTAGALALGMVVGLDTVRAMDPLPQFIPATPRAPYQTPHMVPADDAAYPVAVMLPPQPEERSRSVAVSYAPDDENIDDSYAASALATTQVPSQVEIEPLDTQAPADDTDLQ